MGAGSKTAIDLTLGAETLNESRNNKKQIIFIFFRLQFIAKR
jgi:hypothetical protein